MYVTDLESKDPRTTKVKKKSSQTPTLAPGLGCLENVCKIR
jgi:hypothetical protein